MEKWAVGNRDQRGKVENGEEDDRIIDGETSKYFDILKGVAQGCSTLSPTLFKVLLIL